MAVSPFLVHWFLLGINPGNPVSWAKRASHPVLGIEGTSGKGTCCLTTGTCRVRGPSSIRLQLVTGLCSPCSLGFQGGCSAPQIRRP